MSSQSKYVVAIGPNDYDRFFECKQHLIVGSKCVVECISEGVGGFIANAASVASHLGAKTYVFDAVGHDEYGDRIIDDLKSHNVLLDGIERGDYGNYLVDIYLSNGDRTCLIHDVRNRPRLTLNQKQRDILQSAGFVYSCFSSLKKLSDYETVVPALAKKGTKFFFDAERTTFSSYDSEKLFFDSSSILSFNKNAYAHFVKTSGLDAFEALRSDKNRIIILTKGEDGTTILQGENEYEFPAFKVDSVVDPSGAGDTFNGAFLYGLVNSWSIEKCGEFASIAAARAVTRLGSRSGCATESEIWKFGGK